MLQKDEVEQLLIEAYSAEMLILGDMSYLYRGKLTHKLAVRSYAKSKSENVRITIQTDGNIYSSAIEKMAHISGVCVQEEKDHLILLVGSGVWKMNPAVVEMCFYDTYLEVAAWAKEGFIKQHTAEKAIQKCLAALELSQ